MPDDLIPENQEQKIDPSEFQKLLDEVASLKKANEGLTAKEQKAADDAKAAADAAIKKATAENDTVAILAHERKMKAELEDIVRGYQDKEKDAEKASIRQEMKDDVLKHLGGKLSNEKYLKMIDWDKVIMEVKDGKRTYLNGKEIAEGLRKEFPEAVAREDGKTGADAPKGGKVDGDNASWKSTIKGAGGLLGGMLD